MSSYFLGCSGQPGRNLLKHCGQDSESVWHGDTSGTEMVSPDLSSHHEDPKEQRKGEVIYMRNIRYNFTKIFCFSIVS